VECIRDEVQVSSALQPSCKPREHVPEKLVTGGKRHCYNDRSQNPGATSNSSLVRFKQKNGTAKDEVTHHGHRFERRDLVERVGRRDY